MNTWVSAVKADTERIGLQSVFGVSSWRKPGLCDVQASLQIAMHGQLQSDTSNLTYHLARVNQY